MYSSLRLLLNILPSFWWNPDKFIGPAEGAARGVSILIDSRDTETDSRLEG